MQSKQLLKPVAFAGCCVWAACGFAQGVPMEAKGYQFKGITLYPSLNQIVGYDDNLLLQDEDIPGPNKNTGFSVTSPALRAEASDETKLAALNYRFDSGSYFDSSRDNFSDHDFSMDLGYNPTDRWRLSATGFGVWTHDPRGTGRQEGVVGAIIDDNPDKYRDLGGNALVSYGAPTARGRLDVGGNYFKRQYRNNRSGTRTKDRRDAEGRGTFFWRIMPKTSLLFEGTAKDIDYRVDPDDRPSLDSNEYGANVGVTWEATFKTTGTARVGWVRKDFDDRGDEDEFGWRIGAQWRPRTYSTVDLLTYREPRETNNVGNFYMQTRVGVDWTHAWLPRFSSIVRLGYHNDDYDKDDRDDDTYRAGLDLTYEFRRWLQFGAGYEYSERDSNERFLDYDRNIVRAFATIVL